MTRKKTFIKYISFLFNLFLVFVLSFSSDGFAQDDVFMIRQKGFIRFFPVYQHWTDSEGKGLSEFSIPVNLYIPQSKNFSMNLMCSQATVRGDAVERLKGITDAQVNLNYYIEETRMIVNLGVNLPTGKKELTLDEFGTSYIISLNMYNFQVPNFGQGLNVSPGLSWALPFSENTVLGIGFSYQYRGSFKPFADMTVQYDPGDEILVTGGFDFRLSETSNLSTDLIYTTYGKDKVGGEEVFVSGKKISVNFQFHWYPGYNELLLFSRYRSKEKNEVAIAGNLLPEEEKTIPDQFEIMGRYKMRLNDKLYGTILTEARFFQETSVFLKTNIIGFGFEAQLFAGPNLKIPLRLKYLTGRIKNGPDLEGFEIGAGIYLDM